MTNNTTPNTLDDYFAALDRLKTGKPAIVARGSRITNDSVSLEAGRGKGSIKRSRVLYADLIAAIEKAAEEQASPKNEGKAKLDKAKGQAADTRRALEAALAREVALLRELYQLKKQLAQLTGSKVVPLRGTARERR